MGFRGGDTGVNQVLYLREDVSRYGLYPVLEREVARGTQVDCGTMRLLG